MNRTCPCGDPHEDKPEAHAALKTFEASGLGDHIDILVSGNGNHGWKVPRAWVVFHGIDSVALPALSKQYGWTQID